MAHAVSKLGVALASLGLAGGAVQAQLTTFGGAGTLLRTVGAALVNAEGPASGLRIDGSTLASGEDVRGAVRRRLGAVTATRLRLEDPRVGTALETTFAALGARVDVESTVRRASEIGRRGPLGVRIAERLLSARGEVDVPLAVQVDAETLVPLLLSLKESADVAPIPARYDFANHAIEPHRPGSVLDVDVAMEAVRRALVAHEDHIVLPRTAVLPKVTTQVVASIDAHETISSYRTSFVTGGREAPRAHNIEVAAGRLDGVVLAPGETTSFNRAVGPRTVDAGFARAFQIYKGEMVEGVGGGTCQVASTLHAAAVYAGLDVVERAPHSRPLGYIGLGLDATVVYPEVDLRIRNPWNFPILIHTKVDAGIVTVELLGERHPARVAVSFATLRVWPFPRRIEVHPELAEGHYLRKEKGLRGYDIRVMRTTTTPLGQPRLETSLDRYPPTPELFWVAPKFDTEQGLPPPPDGEVTAAPMDASAKATENMGDPG